MFRFKTVLEPLRKPMRISLTAGKYWGFRRLLGRLVFVLGVICLFSLAGIAAEPDATDSLTIEQTRIADKFDQLQDMLLRMSELTSGTDPRRSTLLKKVVTQSEQRLVSVQFERLVELIEKDRLGSAKQNQGDIQKDLRVLLEMLLSENRAKRIEAEKARIRAYLKEINRIIKQQKGIQGRTAGRGEPKSLSDEQGRLASKTGNLADEIKANEDKNSQDPKTDDSNKPKDPSDEKPKDPSDEKPKDPSDEKPKDPSDAKPKDPSDAKPKDPSDAKPKDPSDAKPKDPSDAKPKDPSDAKPKDPSDGPSKKPSDGQGQSQEQQGESSSPQEEQKNPAGEKVQNARRRMQEAQKKLDDAEREGAVEKQEEAIRELEEAKAELERILRQLREEEIERTLAMLDARFRKMLKMQRTVLEGTIRIDKVPDADRSHRHDVEAGRLSRSESDIVLEADKALMLLHEDGTSIAFPEAVEQIRADMQQIAQRLARTKVGSITQALEEDVIDALEEMLEALQQEMKKAEERRQKPSNSQGQPNDPPLVDKLAEIKMIRAMQIRVNLRTKRYSKLVEGEQATHPDLLEALDRLAERQERVHQITRDLDLGKNQ